MRFLKSPRFSMLIPYLLLAVAVIVIFRIVMDITYVLSGLLWFWGVMLPFFYGFLLAYILNIPCGALEKLYGRVRSGFIARKKRGLSIISVYLLLILFVFFVLNLIIPQIYNSITFFIENFDNYYNSLLGLIGRIDAYLETDLTGALADQLRLDNILSFLQGFPQDGGGFFNDILWGTLANVGTAVFRMFLALVTSLYILLGKNSIQGYFKRALTAILPQRVSSATFKYTAALNQNFRQYIYTQTIDGLIIGTLATLALTFMGSPYALVLGIMIGLFNYVPYFGSIVATIIAVLIVALTQGLTMGLVATAILIVLQQLDANVIQPKLMSGSFSLSPLLIIISITLGGAISGIFGMIVAIPIMAVLKDLLDSYVAYRENKKGTDATSSEDGP